MVPADTVILDTNVIIEAVSAELLNFTKAPPLDLLRSSEFKVRQLRARYSLLTLWHLAESGRRGLFLRDEMERVVTKVAPPDSGKDTTAFTEVIAYRIVGGLGRLEGLSDDERSSRGNAADAWLVELASEHNAPLLTNEGVTAIGINDLKTSGEETIRVTAKKAGLPVFAPVQYIEEQGIDHKALSERFLNAARDRLLAAPADGEPALHPDKAALLHGLYRFILLDELEPPVSTIPRTLIPWELPL